jgi:isopenicillin N synthase-like dioxygenase
LFPQLRAGENSKDTGEVDRKECFDFWGEEAHKEKAFPVEVSGFKATIATFRESFSDLTQKIFRSFALYLELEDKDFFVKRHRSYLENYKIRSHNDVRANYYPPTATNFEIKEASMRLTEHQDWGTIIFLHQDEVGGLEAKLTNGEWIPVQPIKDSFVINAGIMLEMWSGGVFPATVSHLVQ